MAAKGLKPALLVTGASGFTGRHACQHFHDLGWAVTAAVRKTPPASLLPGVKAAECELTDREQVRQLIDRIRPHYVLHVAGRNAVPDSWRDPAAHMEANVMAPVYLMEAMREFRPDGRLLLAGSRLGVDPAQGARSVPHPYSLSKSVGSWVAEAWSALYDLPVMIAEPSNLIGPGESTGFCMLLAKHIARCELGTMEGKAPFTISSRGAVRRFLDVRDAVSAYEKLLLSGAPGEVYPVTGEQEWTLGEVAERLLCKARGSVPVQWGSETDNAPAPPQSETVRSPSLSELGWRPGIEMEKSLDDILAYARAVTESSR
ncbi:NAD-dependent epimerase/dehydratase family protein [Paenibacillus sp. F411]|uniref:NAD-dependent epimerase/dehydratase family protein n=1 Tax=Paenibacillus sp. F411 TaxID=2820239 RepID=UPI001AAE19E6|nr:NAD-dependent epimerase/dehydratase family protein [Paenibacillus sp. F411]MBO2943988.1 NAD-dependent epimerase/dehydratase family protein [Paenibacillus sp. F411]